MKYDTVPYRTMDNNSISCMKKKQNKIFKYIEIIIFQSSEVDKDFFEDKLRWSWAFNMPFEIIPDLNPDPDQDASFVTKPGSDPKKIISDPQHCLLLPSPARVCSICLRSYSIYSALCQQRKNIALDPAITITSITSNICFVKTDGKNTKIFL